jgi:hypothetical protein
MFSCACVIAAFPHFVIVSVLSSLLKIKSRRQHSPAAAIFWRTGALQQGYSKIHPFIQGPSSGEAQTAPLISCSQRTDQIFMLKV